MMTKYDYKRVSLIFNPRKEMDKKILDALDNLKVNSVDSINATVKNALINHLNIK